MLRGNPKRWYLLESELKSYQIEEVTSKKQSANLPDFCKEKERPRHRRFSFEFKIYISGFEKPFQGGSILYSRKSDTKVALI